MLNPKYKFYIDGVLVIPHYKSIKKKYALESGQQFFRTTLDGSIKLFGPDYDLVWQSNIRDSHIFRIMKLNEDSKSYETYFEASFNKTDCKFDHSYRSCELKLTAKDSYSDILNNYSSTYDLIKLAPAITSINAYKRPLVQIYVAGGNSISNFLSGTYWEDDVNEVITDKDALVNKYFFTKQKDLIEFEVQGAKIAGVNKVYAGDGSGIASICYSSDNAYKVEPQYVSAYEFTLFIKDSNGNALYKSDVISLVATGNVYTPFDDTVFTNVSDETDKATVKNAFTHSVFQRLLCDVNSIRIGGEDLNTNPIALDDLAVDNRNYKRVIGYSGNEFICSSKAIYESTRYGVNDYGQYFTNDILPAVAGISRLLPICRSAWANASIWFAENPEYRTIEELARKAYVIKDTYSIAEAIKALLKKIAPGISHEATSEYSNFLYGSSFIKQANFELFIAPKTNILKGEYDQPAQKAEITFENLMNMLRDCFRCYWYVEDNKLKIEHIYWFMNGGSYSNVPTAQIDLNDFYDQHNGKKLSYKQQSFEYDKTELSSRYEFSWMDDSTSTFEGTAIDVKASYVQKDKTESISISSFSSDIDFMLLSPESFSEDGFALIGAVKTGSSYNLPFIEMNLKDENGNEYSSVMQNGYMSWLYLVNFYMYDMPAYDIEYDYLKSLSVKGIKKCMTQEVVFPWPLDPNLYQYISSEYGDGQIQELSIDIDTRYVTATLIFIPE